MREFRCVATGLEPPRDGPGATQTAPRQAQRSSRQPHEAPRSLQRRPDTPGSDFEANLERSWGLRNLEKPQKVLYCQRISWFSRFRKGAFNRGPKSSKRSPPGGPNEPQARPGRPQERPKSPQDGSKSRPERAKRRPRPPRSAPGEDPRSPKPPRRLQGALREPILASSWGPRGLIFVISRRPFRASRAVRSTDESTGRNHWSKGLSRPLRARCTEAIVH